MGYGSRIKECRKQMKITQKELSDILGVAEITVRKYESDSIDISIKRLEEIAKILNVSSNYLISGMSDDDVKKIGCNVKSIAHTQEFLKSLGYEFSLEQISETDYNPCINGVEYTQSQYNTLINLIKSCIDSTNKIVMESNK